MFMFIRKKKKFEIFLKGLRLFKKIKFKILDYENVLPLKILR